MIRNEKRPAVAKRMEQIWMEGEEGLKDRWGTPEMERIVKLAPDIRITEDPQWKFINTVRGSIHPESEYPLDARMLFAHVALVRSTVQPLEGKSIIRAGSNQLQKEIHELGFELRDFISAVTKHETHGFRMVSEDYFSFMESWFRDHPSSPPGE